MTTFKLNCFFHVCENENYFKNVSIRYISCSIEELGFTFLLNHNLKKKNHIFCMIKIIQENLNNKETMHSNKKKNTSALSSTDVGKKWLGSDQLC